MGWFTKAPSRREQFIADVVASWNDVKNDDKPDLLIKHPTLYFAVARLAAHEIVVKGMKRRV